jgi:type II secretory pathway component PulM
MNQPNINSFSEKILVFIGRVKAALSKDYSLQDVKDLFASRSHGSISEHLTQSPDLAQANTGVKIDSFAIQFDVQKLMMGLFSFVRRQHRLFLFLLIVVSFALLHHYFLRSYSDKIKDQIDMRPTQWSQLQDLVKLTRLSGDSQPIVSVSKLNDFELEKITRLLASKAIKPGVLRLSSDNPPQLEIQMSDVMFSVLLEILDDFRDTWRLYPQELNVTAVSSGGPGLVNVGGKLMQFVKPPVGAVQ